MDLNQGPCANGGTRIVIDRGLNEGGHLTGLIQSLYSIHIHPSCESTLDYSTLAFASSQRQPITSAISGKGIKPSRAVMDDESSQTGKQSNPIDDSRTQNVVQLTSLRYRDHHAFLCRFWTQF